jgi:hypothetical protein
MKPTQAQVAGTMRKIVDFHLDENLDWVAELECGHQQHVRHNDPRPLGDNSSRAACTRRSGTKLLSMSTKV